MAVGERIAAELQPEHRPQPSQSDEQIGAHEKGHVIPPGVGQQVPGCVEEGGEEDKGEGEKGHERFAYFVLRVDD